MELGFEVRELVGEHRDVEHVTILEDLVGPGETRDPEAGHPDDVRETHFVEARDGPPRQTGRGHALDEAYLGGGVYPFDGRAGVEEAPQDALGGPGDGADGRDPKALIDRRPPRVIDASNDPLNPERLARDAGDEDVRVVPVGHRGERTRTLDPGFDESIAVETDALDDLPDETVGKTAKGIGPAIDDRDAVSFLGEAGGEAGADPPATHHDHMHARDLRSQEANMLAIGSATTHFRLAERIGADRRHNRCMKIAVTGSHGLIGSALVPALETAGHRVVRIVRSASAGPDEITWNLQAGTVDHAALEGIDAVVHLAGAGIGDHRWTPKYKREIVESRTRSTSLLAQTLAALEGKPAVLLSGSAVGWYGARGDEVLDETSAAGTGFLADACRAWEEATSPAETAGIRTAHLRSGVVLSAAGGALKKQLPLFRLGLGGRIGPGTQWQSWISIDDEVAAIAHLLTANLRGAVNLTAPNPVTGADFAATLARVLKRPARVPVPSFGPRLMLGRELADTLLFTGQKVHPGALVASGFVFAQPTLEGALRALLKR